MAAAPITVGCDVTLINQEHNCFLEAAGSNQTPTVRVDDGRPLLGFQDCVFKFLREHAKAAVGSDREVAYGTAVTICSPVTRTAAVVLKTESSDGSTGFRVVMRPPDEKTSIFRILPKFKARANSDIVSHGDSVAFVLDSSDLFLCVGEGNAGLEVMASGEPAVWSVSRYDRAVPFDPNNIIQAGRLLMLQHRAQESLLVSGRPVVPAEKKKPSRRHSVWQAPLQGLESTGTAFSTDDAGGARTVTDAQRALAKKRTTDVYFSLLQTQAGDTADRVATHSLWIVENADPTAGGPLLAGERYRVRHFVTGRYLAVIPHKSASANFVVATVGAEDGGALDQSLFDLESTTENESGHVGVHSFVRLKHVKSGQWLGALPQTDFAVSAALPFAKIRTRDRLFLKHVPPAVEADTFFVMSQLGVLRRFVAAFHELQEMPRSVERVVALPAVTTHLSRAADAVAALVRFVSQPGGTADQLTAPVVERQALLGELGVPELLLRAAVAPFHSRGAEIVPPVAGGVFNLSDVYRKELQPVVHLCRGILRLLRQVVLRHRANAAAILPFLETMLFLESCNLQVTASLHALLEHTHLLTDESMSQACGKVLVLNERSRHASYLDALANFCTSARATGIVCTRLEDHPTALVPTEIDEGRLIVRGHTEFESPMQINAFIAHGDTGAVAYFGAYARLVLAIGREGLPGHREFCRRCFPRDEILILLSCSFRDAKNQDLADGIKATFLDLAMVLYLSSELNAPLEPRTVAVSSAFPPKVGAAASAVVDGTFVRQVKLIALEHIKASAVMVQDLQGQNALLCNCVTAWHLFVRCRIASGSELREMLPVLVNVLDGESDVRSMTTSDEGWSRYDYTDDSAIVIKAKGEICALLRTYVLMCVTDAITAAARDILAQRQPGDIAQQVLEDFDAAVAVCDPQRLATILLDLSLYSSPKLLHDATNLACLVLRLRAVLVDDLRTLHCLPPALEAPYARVLLSTKATQAAVAANATADALGHLTTLVIDLRAALAAAAEAGEDGAVFLNMMRTWGMARTVLSIMPEDPPPAPSTVALCADFFALYAEAPENVADVAPHWPRFFDVLETSTPAQQDAVLRLLRRVWYQGNVGCPAHRNDIRLVLHLFARDSSRLPALDALVALMSGGVPSPAQQRDIVLLINEFDVCGRAWWSRLSEDAVCSLTRLLELCSVGTNGFARRLVQGKLPPNVLLQLIAAAPADRLAFKAVLVRFLTAAHFTNEDRDKEVDGERYETGILNGDEGWWRIIRDDFLVRLDELASATDLSLEQRGYVLDAALALQAFFTHQFNLPHVSKLDWVVKELRGVLSTVTHMMGNAHRRELDPSERQILFAMARSLHSATVALNDPAVAKLKTVLANTAVMARRSIHAPAPAASGSHESALLATVQSLVADRVETAGDAVPDRLVDVVCPVHFADRTAWQQRVLQRLLDAAGTQSFEPAATRFVMTLARRCVEAAPPGRESAMQVLFEQIGALRVSTALIDAVDTSIVAGALELGIATVHNGERQVQNNFLHFLGSTDEQFFLGFRRTVDRSVQELLHWRRTAVQSASHRFDIFSAANSFGSVKQTMRFIQLLCEGHNLGMQDYVREQKDNLHSVNTLQVTLLFLRALLAGDTTDFEDVLEQALNLLTEFCQGPCQGNQALLVASNLCEMLHRILLDDVKPSKVKQAAATLLLALVEGCTEPHVAEAVLRQVPLSALRAVFLQPMASEEETELVFSVGIFLRVVLDLLTGTQYHHQIQQLLSQRKDVGQQTGRIQIERGEAIESVYFRIPQACRSIREESKRRLLWDVDRSSQAAKHSSFYEACDDTIIEMDLVDTYLSHLQGYIQRMTFLPLHARQSIADRIDFSMDSWVTLSVVIAAAINVLISLDFGGSPLVLLLGLGQVLVSGLIVFIDWVIAGNVMFHKHKKRLTQLRQSVAEDTVAPAVEITPARELLFRLGRGRCQIGLLMFIVAISGCLVTPYIFAVHLFWVITLSPAFANVIAAITQNAKTLSLTLVLGILFCYMFAIVGYALFPEDFDTDSDPNSHENCSSLLHCFLFIITTGLRQGGGVGDVMRAKAWGSEHFLTRKFFDFIFFGIMIIVFLNILFGIIIDTFAELRDAKTRKEEDMRLRCFICGFEAHVFDRHGEGFAWHVKHEHNMWQYLYFIHHLRLKDPNDYTGQETYIASLLELKDFSFFPQRCLSLESKPKALLALASAPSTVDDATALIAGGGFSGHGQGAVLGPEAAQTAAVNSATLTAGEVRLHLDTLNATMRRMAQRQLALGAGDGAGRGGGGGGDGGRAATLDSATQTQFGESIAGLQCDLANAKADVARLQAGADTMRAEMKAQVEELWRLQVANQSTVEMQGRIHALEAEQKDLRRQVGILQAEKDTLVRQTAFLQDEADGLLVENTRMQAAARVRAVAHAPTPPAASSQPDIRSLTREELLTHGSGVHAPPAASLSAQGIVQESLQERSRLFDSLQIEVPQGLFDAVAQAGRTGSVRSPSVSATEPPVPHRRSTGDPVADLLAGSSPAAPPQRPLEAGPLGA